MNPQPAAPWRLAELLGLAATLVVGLAALVVGWIGVSGEPATARQTTWLNVGIGGLVVAGIGTATWLMTGRRAVGARRRRLLPDLALAAAPEIADTRPERLVVLPGMARYHRSTCELVAGKKASPVGRARKLSPCGVCEPGPIEARA